MLRGQVTICIIASITTDAVDLAGLLADFHDRHPGVNMTLAVGSSAAILDGLLADRYDLAIIGLGAHAPRDVYTTSSPAHHW